MQIKKELITPLVIAIIALIAVGGGIYWYASSSDTDEGALTDENTTGTQQNGAATTGGTSGGSNNTAGTQVVAGWKTYTNQKYGYSFRYPSNWIVGNPSAPSSSASAEVFGVYTQDGKMAFRIEAKTGEPKDLNDAATQVTVPVAGLSRMAYMYPTGRTQCPGGVSEDCSMFIVPVHNNGTWLIMTAEGNARSVAGVYADMIASFNFDLPSAQTFENKTYKFSFSHPSDWKVTDMSSTQTGKVTAAARIASAVRNNLAGYENIDVQFVLSLNFDGGKVTIVDQGFIKADTAPSAIPTKLQLTPAALSATTEYKTAQAIIASAKSGQ